jgi:hypothetical protein
LTITLLNGIEDEFEDCKIIGGRTIGWAVTVWIDEFGLVDEDDERRTMDGGLPDIENYSNNTIQSPMGLFLQ